MERPAIDRFNQARSKHDKKESTSKENGRFVLSLLLTEQFDAVDTSILNLYYACNGEFICIRLFLC